MGKKKIKDVLEWGWMDDKGWGSSMSQLPLMFMFLLVCGGSSENSHGDRGQRKLLVKRVYSSKEHKFPLPICFAQLMSIPNLNTIKECEIGNSNEGQN